MTESESIRNLLRQIDITKINVFNELLNYLLIKNGDTKESKVESYKLAIFFYLKEIEHMSMYSIKKLFKDMNVKANFNYRSLSKQSNKLKNETVMKTMELIEKYGK